MGLLHVYSRLKQMSQYTEMIADRFPSFQKEVTGKIEGCVRDELEMSIQTRGFC